MKPYHSQLVRIPTDLYEQLKNWADPQGLSVNAAIRQSIWKMLNTSSAPTSTVSPPKPAPASTDSVVAEFLANWDRGLSEEQHKAVEAAEQETSAPEPVAKQSLEDIVADWGN